MLKKLITLLALFLVPVQLLAQTQTQRPASRATKEIAAAELNSVLAEAGRLDDKVAFINVKARAAALVSLSDPVKAEILFLELWRFAKSQPDEDFDRERALTLILRHVFPRNPKLAKQLLGEWSKAAESLPAERVTGRDPGIARTAKLASQLVDDDPRAAAEILEQNLTTGISGANLNVLLQLRERNALLSDSVVARTLDTLGAQSDLVSLSGLQLLSAYVFPESANVDLSSSLESLRLQYFSTTQALLQSSLAASEAALLKDQRYTQADLRLRGMYQALVAQTLAALAPRYRPNLAPELNALANKLVTRLPDNVAQLSKFTTARLSGNQTVPDNPDLAIPLAIQNGDLEEAERLIDDLKSDELRKTHSQLLAKVRARALLAKGDVSGAVTEIRKLEDQGARLVLYLESMKAIQKKRDLGLANLVIGEARTLIPPAGRNGMHVRLLLAFSSQLTALGSTDEAMEFLDAAVVSLNSLPKQPETPEAASSGTAWAWSQINDPRSLMDEPEFARAFSSSGAVDIERALIEARKIGVRPLQLIARLEAAGEVLRIEARRPKSKPATKTAASSG